MLVCCICGKKYDSLQAELHDRFDCDCGGGLVYPDEFIHGLYEHDDRKDVPKMNKKQPRIRADIQSEVDEYIELDAQMKTIQAQLKAKRKIIEPYMEERNLQVIKGTFRGSISLEPRNMAITNARYTSYDVRAIEPLLDPKVKRECIVKVVDKDMLELMIKTGKVPQSVQQYKLFKESKAFTINHK